MKFAIGIILLICIADFVQCLPTWPQRYFNAQKSCNSFSNRTTIICQPTQDYVRYDINPPLAETIEPIVGNNYAVYYIRGINNLKSLNTQTNNQNWEISSGISFSGLALSSDGSILYTVKNMSLFMALNSSNGEMIWSYPIVNSQPLSTRNIVVHQNGMIFYYQHGFMTQTGSLYAFGAPPSFGYLWNYSIEAIENSPTIGTDGNVYIVDSSSKSSNLLIALNATNGNIIWNKFVGNGFGTTQVRSDGIIVAFSNCGTLLLSQNGTTISYFSNMTISATLSDNRMVGLLNSCFIQDTFALLNPDGSKIWEQTIDIQYGQIVYITVDGEYILVSYTANSIGYVTAYNISNGGYIWSFSAQSENSPPTGSVVPVGDGSLLYLLGANLYHIVQCNNKGFCNGVGSICDCEENWYTDNCSVICNTENCISKSNGHGGCNPTTGICECDEDYFPTNNCSLYCNQTKCSQNKTGHASCSKGYCVCNEKYFREDCSLYCNYGIFENNSCFCNEGYFGDNCTLTCDDEISCQGHGTCNSNGNCVCFNGYSGINCNSEHSEASLNIGIIVGISVCVVVLIGFAIAFIIWYRTRRAVRYKRIQN